MRVARLGIVQFESIIGDVDANIGKAEKAIAEISELGADIAVFPEMFTTGYNMNLIGDRLHNLALTLESHEVKRLCDAAKAYSMWVVAPLAERRADGRLYNSAVVIDSDGAVRGSYAKTHLWTPDKRYFTSGDEFLVFDSPFGRFGIMICYDAGFPEVARSLTLMGAEFIIMPSAWRIQDKDIWDLNIPQRALENVLYVVAVNRVGKEGDLHLFGDSKVADPRGRIIAELPIDEEASKVVELNIDLLKTFREQVPYLGDRRPDLYALLGAKER